MVRVRFAPSPTGFLHVGGARTAIFNWLYARNNGGTFVLRIEDTDRERSTKESTDAILEGLTWLGMDYDEGPFFQSDRTEIYLEHVDKLLNTGCAYRCTCSQETLDEKRKKAMAEGRKPKYDGACRYKALSEEDVKNSPFVIRFKAENTGETVVDDKIRGRVVFENKELDDFIILRTDGSPTYNFVVTVDDALMNITHIIRGDDHINNTPKQTMIYNALGYKLPVFAHLPMIFGSDKARLSKRHGATSVTAYRDMGYMPHALFNYLVRLGWSHGDEEIFSKAELIDKFSLDNVAKSPAIFNTEKLTWLNSHYIKNETNEKLAVLLSPFLEKSGVLSSTKPAYIEKVVKTLKERCKTIGEMAEYSRFYFTENYPFDEKATKKFLKNETHPTLVILAAKLESLSSFEEEDIEKAFREVESELGIRLKDIAQPARVALTGTKVSPGLFEVIWVLGKERTVSRIRRALSQV